MAKQKVGNPKSWCWKIHFETKKQSQKWEDWSFVHFSQCEMELDYIIVSRLMLVQGAKGLRKH